MTATANAQRLAKYKDKMAAAGFRRLSFYVSSEMATFLDEAHQMGECRGRTLERLLLGEAAKRPDYWTPEELARKRVRRQAARTKKRQRQ